MALTGERRPLKLRPDAPHFPTHRGSDAPPSWRRPMPLRLLVVDGGDRGQAFPLPASGVIRIGNYGGHTDICLHDLYVAKDHCHIEIADDGRVTVTAQPSAAGTLVNGAKVVQRELKPGDVVRVGNSFLRLEEVPDESVVEAGPSGTAGEEPSAGA